MSFIIVRKTTRSGEKRKRSGGVGTKIQEERRNKWFGSEKIREILKSPKFAGVQHNAERHEDTQRSMRRSQKLPGRTRKLK